MAGFERQTFSCGICAEWGRFEPAAGGKFAGGGRVFADSGCAGCSFPDHIRRESIQCAVELFSAGRSPLGNVDTKFSDRFIEREPCFVRHRAIRGCVGHSLVRWRDCRGHSTGVG